MAPRDDYPDVVTALEEFIQEALAHLEQRYGSPIIGPTLPYSQQWERLQDETFQVRQWESGWLRGPFLAEDAFVLAELPTYGRVREALLADEWLGSQLDTLVGTSRARTRVQLETVLEVSVLRPVIVETQSFAFDAERYGRRIDSLLEALAARELPEDDLVLIFGLSYQGEAFELDHGIVVRRLRDEELSLAINLGIIPDSSPLGNSRLRTIAEADQWCVSHHQLVPKVVGADPHPSTEASRVDLHDAAERFVTAVRLVTAGTVVRGPKVTFSFPTPLSMGQGGSFEKRLVNRPADLQPASLISELVDDVRRLWRQLGTDAARGDSALQIALRRLQDAGVRMQPADRLIDLAIAAEALFLTGITPAEERGEMTFRLALHAALFTDVPGRSRPELRRFMTRAYRARSAIVHGGTADRGPLLAGGEGSLPECTGDLELVMQTALRQAVRLVAQGRRTELHDWTARVTAALERVPPVSD